MILVMIYVKKKIPIGNNFLNLNNELIQYLQQTCNICNSEKQWKQNEDSIYDSDNNNWPSNTNLPGECVPRFTGVENRINEKNDGTNNYSDCTGIWNTKDFH